MYHLKVFLRDQGHWPVIFYFVYCSPCTISFQKAISLTICKYCRCFHTTSQKCTQSWCHLWKWSKNGYIQNLSLCFLCFIQDRLWKIHAFITCRIDQCNSLLYGLGLTHNKTQRIQNSAARLVTRTRFHDHITPVLQKLHWLPVRYRNMYNILIFTYKCIHGLTPLYLQ